ncbi:TonB-dependent receptor [Novosphingobium sp. BL-52-GroH]|uniref:TonB-dependent receptor n=1 Tax=Novosphingobium sp. BL-52-GroH TaxID=3349877 RepID=UPI00384DECBE
MSYMTAKQLRTNLLRGAAIAALATFPTMAPAQTAPAADDGPAGESAAASASGDILVTARKQTERLLDVPINVTALNSAALSEHGVKNLYDLMQTTPSLSFATAGQRNQVKLTLRGLGVSTTGVNKVSVFLDGVYVAGDFTGLSLAGMERVEVLKGPQSAVFGRSTFAGAINYVTREPSELTGGLSVDAGTFNEIHADGYISAPIVDDKIYGFLSASYMNIDGPKAWTDVDGTHHGAQTSRGFMGKLTLKPTENLTIRGLVSYHKIDDGPGSALFVDPGKRNRVVNKINPVTGATVPSTMYFEGAIPTFNPKRGDYNYFQEYLSDPGDRISQWRTYVQGEYSLADDHTLTVTAARNTQDSESQSNFIFRNRPTVSGSSVRNSIGYGSLDDKSVELRFASPQDQWIRYAAGAYYLKIKQKSLPSIAYTVNSTAAADRVSAGDFSETDTRDRSLFGALYVDPIARVTVSAELRYQEERVHRTSTPTTSVLVNAYTPGTTTPINTAGIVDLTGTYKSWLPRFNIQYKFSPDANVYATYSKGTNPGGFNTAAQRRTDQTLIKEETLENFELGFKARLFDSLSINAAAYYMKWNNQQTTGSFYAYCTTTGTDCMSNPSGASTVANLYSVVENRGKSTVKGAEIDAAWQTPLAGLTLRDGLSYNDGKYKTLCSSNYAALLYSNTAPPNNCVSVAGNSLESISKWQNSFNADYEIPIDDDWSLYMRGDWQYQSKQYESELNYAYTPGFHIFNARVGFQSGTWTFEVFGKNLSNNHTPYRATRSSDSNASVAGVTGGATNQYNQSVTFTPRLPRQFGARVAMKF